MGVADWLKKPRGEGINCLIEPSNAAGVATLGSYITEIITLNFEFCSTPPFFRIESPNEI